MPDTAHRSFSLLFIPIPPGYRVQLCRLCLVEEASGAKVYPGPHSPSAVLRERLHPLGAKMCSSHKDSSQNCCIGRLTHL